MVIFTLEYKFKYKLIRIGVNNINIIFYVNWLYNNINNIMYYNNYMCNNTINNWYSNMVIM